MTSRQVVKVVNELKKGILNYSKPALHIFGKVLSHLIDLVFDLIEKAMIFKDAGNTMPGRVRDIFTNFAKYLSIFKINFTMNLSHSTAKHMASNLVDS